MAKPKSASKKPAPKKKSKGGGKRAPATPKSEEVDVAVGSLLSGDNMPKIKDLSYHYQNILGLMEKAASAQSRVSEAKKRAKEAGVDTGALMTAMKLTRLDPLDLAALLKQQAALMSELGLPVQMTLFEPKYGSVEAQAAAEGSAAGKAGRTPDTDRWPEGTPGHADYMRSWNDEQAILAKRLGSDT